MLQVENLVSDPIVMFLDNKICLNYLKENYVCITTLDVLSRTNMQILAVGVLVIVRYCSTIC